MVEKSCCARLAPLKRTKLADAQSPFDTRLLRNSHALWPNAISNFHSYQVFDLNHLGANVFRLPSFGFAKTLS